MTWSIPSRTWYLWHMNFVSLRNKMLSAYRRISIILHIIFTWNNPNLQHFSLHIFGAYIYLGNKNGTRWKHCFVYSIIAPCATVLVHFVRVSIQDTDSQIEYMCYCVTRARTRTPRDAKHRSELFVWIQFSTNLKIKLSVRLFFSLLTY